MLTDTLSPSLSIARFLPRSRSHRRARPQVNYLGHFLLTNQLMPLLRAAPAPRVVSVASVASYLPTAMIQLDDLQRASPLSYGRPCTLRPAPCTLHPAPCTLHPAPCTLHPAPHAPRPAPHVPRSCTTPVDCFAYHQSELPGGKSCHRPHMTTATAHT
jgi:NAD(P)-dependent dehydrogenase (short-subunit alcohol dehydrogenase family)